MTRSDRVKLAEISDLLDIQFVAGEMQPAVEKHGAVAGRENKPVAVQPAWRVRVVIESFAEKNGTDFGAAERKSEVAGVTSVDGVHGKATGLVGSGR